MKFLVSVIISFIFTTSSAQVDSLRFAFDDENDYFERMKIAEILFDRDSTNDELNEILYDYFDLIQNKEKLCVCHRNSNYAERQFIIVGRELYGDFTCSLVQNNISVAEYLFDFSKRDERYYVVKRKMIYDLSGYHQDKRDYKKALSLIREYPFNWNPTANWYENRAINQYVFLLSVNREYEELSTVYDTLLKRNPTSIYYLTHAAQTNTYIKKYDRAIELYTKAIEFDKDQNGSIYIELAKVFSKNNDTLKANENYEKAIKIDSITLKHYYDYIKHLEEYERYVERDSLIKVVLLKPVSDFESEIPSEIYEYYSYISLNRRQKLAYIKQAIKIESDSIQLANLYNVKGVYEGRSNHKQAFKSYTKALEYDSTSVEPYLNRGDLYLRKWKLKSQEKAKSDFEKALIYSQFSYYPSLANLGLGKYYYYKRNYDEATKKLNLSIDQNPDNSWAYYYLSRISYSQRDYEKSIELLEKAVELNPNESLFSITLEVEKEYLLKQKSSNREKD